MSGALERVHDVLANDNGVTALVGARIAPLQAEEGVAFPRIVMTVVAVEPHNALDGYAGLDRVEVQVDAWSLSYQEAETISAAARAALEAAQYLCLSRIGDLFSPLSVLNAGAYRVGHVFQLWI